MTDEATQTGTMAAADDGSHPALARAVAQIHVGIVVFFTAGWLLPWSVAHWLVIGGGTLLPVSWALFDNDCPLTRLERRLAGTARGAEPHGQRYFVSRLLSRILGRTVSDRTGNITVYTVLFSSIFISATRLAL